ncbi:DUF4333 domain-containing protein [Nocardia arizonensis]|uniref:DUF4333 domain-containing protein n=1 Tax=Nocardia arizonensis TaxID=1141647 RepID=UPI0006D29522|nr:DUF4333 domain-containing protein [Nocardia arizonensis]
MSGPYGPNDGDGRNDPTQVWSGGQQTPGGAGPTQQWGAPQSNPSQAQPTQQWGGQPQQWGQPQTGGQPQWGQPQTGAQPQQQWGQSQPQWGQQPQQQWGQSQPQWGQQPQQQWGQGQPQPTPPSGGKGKGLFIGLAVLAVLVIGAVVALVVVLTSKDKLDQAAVQNGVKKVLTDSYGIQDVADVSCPSGQEVKVDATFECTLKVSGEQKKVNIKITNDNGTYEVGRPS